MKNSVEELAVAVGCSRTKLRQRLQDARSCLSAVGRRLFRDATFDFENKRMVTADGKYALQWKLRSRPNEPESYTNQQTNRGTVVLVQL